MDLRAFGSDMQLSFDLKASLEKWVMEAAQAVADLNETFRPEIRPADPRFGDFQANGVLPYAKLIKANPRALAVELTAALRAHSGYDATWVEIDIAGPGFINFKFTPKFLQEWLSHFRGEADFQAAANTRCAEKTMVVDYPSPNTAKQMHIGHIRPMVIGDAVQRLLRFSGAKVIRDNHIGDWGTNFGTLIMAIKRAQYTLDTGAPDALQAIESLYKQGTELEKSDPAIREESRNELVKLQNGDAENHALWEKIVTVSNRHCQAIYDFLGIEIDITLGESFYRDRLDRIYAELGEVGLAELSEGAQVVFHPEHPRFKTQPFIIRKQDGASNYATTDLATALYRVEELRADEIIYVTDGRQQDHFAQLFMTVEKWFARKNYPLPRLEHVWFGTILGADGKAIKTKSGESIKLIELLNEAVQRAFKIVDAKNPELSDEEKQAVARVVGIGAIRYADLSSNRTGDYVFAWEKLLSFEGNTAPYLLYAIARIHSIFKKAQIDPNVSDWEVQATGLETAEEIVLAHSLVAFPVALDLALSELRPHHLCTYLYELAGQFSSFYNANKVIVEDPQLQSRRLMLCARTMRTLETGLHLLGIETLERM